MGEPTKDSTESAAPAEEGAAPAAPSAEVHAPEGLVTPEATTEPEKAPEPETTVVGHRALRDFKARVGWHGVISFIKDEIIDPLIGAELHSKGAPVEPVTKEVEKVAEHAAEDAAKLAAADAISAL